MTDARFVMSTFGFFIIFSLILGLTGISSEGIELPEGPSRPADSQGAESTQRQGFVSAVVECAITGPISAVTVVGHILTLGGIDLIAADCSRNSKTTFFTDVEAFFTGVSNAIVGVIRFAISLLSFMFQLLTFQIPEIPVFLNAIIVLPPYVGLAYLAFSNFTGRASA